MNQTLTQHVTLSANPFGLSTLVINNKFARAEVSLFGGHLLSYQRHGEAPLVWLSEKAILDGIKAIRGGVPICWPWFGPAPARVGSDKPQHGFVRTAEWQLDGVVEDVDGTLIQLSIKSSEQTKALWPHDFELELNIQIGRTVTIALTTCNEGHEPLIYSGALHSYLELTDLEHTTIYGLGEQYDDRLNGGLKHDSAPLTINGGMDRIYTQPAKSIEIKDGARTLTVLNGHNDSVVVWTPWEGCAKMADMTPEGYRTMICVESAITSPDGVTVAAGEEHTLFTVIG